MKHHLLFLVLLIANLSYSQFLNELQYDSIVKIENTDLSLIYLKKKMAVWHDANFFVAKPTKNYFIYLESAELLVEVDLKHQNFYAIVEDQQFGGFKRFYIANTEFKADIFRDHYTQEKSICFDGYLRNIQLDITDSTSCKYSDGNFGKFGLKFENKKLIINDKIISDYIDEYAEVYIDSEGNDSLDNEGNVVYFQPELIPGVANSGILDVKTKNWIIQRKYSEIQVNQNYVLVSTELNSKKEYLDSACYYQLFKLDKKGNLSTINHQITDNNVAVIQQMTNYDSIRQLNDKTHFVTYKNGKQGLIEYQLFNTYYDNYTQLFTKSWIQFSHSQLLPNDYKFVYYSHNRDAAVYVKNGYYSIAQYQHGEFTIIEDSVFNSHLIKDELVSTCIKSDIITGKIIEENSEGYINYKFGFNVLNDSLVKIVDIQFEENPMWAAPVESVDYPGEDSIDVNGNLVYYPSDPGQYHCGLYNLYQNKWVISPNEYDIQYFGGNHMVVEKPIFDENHIIQSEGYKSIYDFNGTELESNLEPMTCITEIETLSKLVLQGDETIEPYQISQFANQNIPDSIITPPYYFKVKNKSQEKIVKTELNGTTPVISQLSDFHDLVIYDPSSNFEFNIDNKTSTINFRIIKDSLGTIIPETFTITAEKYNLDIYTVLDYGPIVSALAVLSIDGNTTFIEFGMTTEKEITDTIADYKSRTKRVISIHKNENELIYNISQSKGEYSNYYDYYENYDYPEGNKPIRIDWEQEIATIYHLKNNNWIRSSPYYSSVQKLNFGYLCKTGEYAYWINESWGEEILSRVESSYILLDSTLKPIGFSDYYNFDLIEDLGFGYKIIPTYKNQDWYYTTGYGNAFFIDYNATPLCNAEYDDFILENGKIYGIKNTIVKMDKEYYEEYIDENGNYIYLQKYERILIGEIEK